MNCLDYKHLTDSKPSQSGDVLYVTYYSDDLKGFECNVSLRMQHVVISISVCLYCGPIGCSGMCCVCVSNKVTVL